MRCSPQRSQSRRGQSLVESTFVLLLLFSMIIGLADAGQVLFTHQSLTDRVRTAARWVSLREWQGPDVLVNQILYEQPGEPEHPVPFLGLKPENVKIRYQPATESNPDEERVTVEIVNFKSHLFSPFMADALISPRPVLVTVPLSPHVP